MHEIGTTTDEDTGNSTTIYGSDGVMSAEEAVENGVITEEENKALDDIFANW